MIAIPGGIPVFLLYHHWSLRESLFFLRQKTFVFWIPPLDRDMFMKRFRMLGAFVGAFVAWLGVVLPLPDLKSLIGSFQ